MRYAVLKLAGTYHETAPAGSPLSLTAGKVFRHDLFYLRAGALVRSRRVERVLVVAEPSFRPAFVGGLESVRSILSDLAASGKELWFYADDYADAHLYLAAACAHRVIHPMGSLRCVGLHREAFFFKRLMDRFGVQVQVVRRGRYKSAYDRLRLERIDPLNQQQYSRWLTDAAAVLHDGIRAGYGETPPLQELLDGRLLDPEGARTSGWVDTVATRSELLAGWKEQKIRKRALKTPRSAGRGRTVAVLVVEGLISRGTSGFTPLLGPTTGAESLIADADRLQKDRSVAAVVLRINSGGGDAAASEDIRVALGRLAGSKPLVVSMGDVAGSGGYLIATAGRRIFAERSSLTGSVGVIALSPAFGAALERLGVTRSSLTTHEHADAAAGMRPLSAGELQELDAHVASIYDRFVAVVAECRGRAPEEIHRVAEGRVWSGIAAVECGLVDQVGNLDAAITAARDAAGLARARVTFHPRRKRSFLQKRLARSLAGVPVGMMPSSVSLADLAGRPLLLQPEALDPLFRLDDRLLHLFHADL